MKMKNNAVIIFIILLTIFAHSEPLQVISVSPMPNSEYVKLDSNIEITFNKEVFAPDINQFTFTVNDGYTDIKGSIKYFKLLKKAVFIPTERLITGRKYKVTLWAGIRDLQNGRLPSSVIWIFSTGKTKDTSRPFIVSMLPLDGETNIALEPEIKIAFSERINADTYKHIKLFDPENKEVKCKIVEGSNKNKIVMIPEKPLLSEKTYIIHVGKDVSDISGNIIGFDETSIFKVKDNVPPGINRIVPEEETRKVKITQTPKIFFTDEMLQESLNTDTIKLMKDKDEQEILLKYHHEINMVEIIPQKPLEDGVFYEVHVKKGVMDKGTNLLKPFSWEFKTEDLTGPKLIEYSPKDGTENVELNEVIKLKFSEILDKETVKNGIVITDGDNIIPYRSEINEFGINVNIYPEKLEKKKTYRVTLKSDIKDLEGNALNDLYSFGFKTILFDTQEIRTKLNRYSEYDEQKALEKVQNMIGMDHYENYLSKEQAVQKEVRDRIPPRIVDIFPVKDMKDVPVNTRITALFSEEIKSHTLDGGIIISDGVNRIPYKTEYSRKFRKVNVVFEKDLEPAREYRVIFTDKILDLGSNSLLSYEWRFTTAKDSKHPKIISKLPEIKPEIDKSLLKEDIVEMKKETLEDLREEEEIKEEIEVDESTRREKWAKNIVIDLRKKFAKQYAIVTANPKVKPTRYELAMIIRSIIKKVNKNQLNRLFRHSEGIKDLIQLFQASVEYERELNILGVNVKDFEERLKNHKIPVSDIRSDIYKGIIKGIK